METEIFMGLLQEKEFIMGQFMSINERISTMATTINKKHGREIFDGLKGIFPIEQVVCIGKNEDYVVGEYKEDIRAIVYDLDITDYLLDKYKHDYKKLINRKNKHKISFIIEYDILCRNFNTTLVHHGILYAGLIREEKLRKATSSMLKVCKENFDATKLNIEEIPYRFVRVKEVFDDYEGYLVTTTLCAD